MRIDLRCDHTARQTDHDQKSFHICDLLRNFLPQHFDLDQLLQLAKAAILRPSGLEVGAPRRSESVDGKPLG